jgi:hypothetical protein
LGTKWGKEYEFNLDAYNLKEIVGKPIKFSTNESICGLTTEPLSDLKTTFASDIQTAALVLLIKPDQNPERIWPPGNQAAILIGSFKILSAAEKVEADKAFAEKAAVEEKASADRAAKEKAAADKAAADKAAADKAAADKAAADKAAADKAAAVSRAEADACAIGESCKVGNTGPGGGIVFYDAGSEQSWGRYLEFAPNDWSGNAVDPKAVWCNVVDIPVVARPTEIGKGKTNTDSMLASCNSGAAAVAREYRGGAKDDWSLPSRDELNELCKFVNNQATGNSKTECIRSDYSMRKGFVNDSYGGYYWSSSDGLKSGAWRQIFANGIQDSGKQYYFNYVRPIRAF